MESSPAVASGIVYVGSSDHNVYALNATSGAKAWSYQTSDMVTSSPAVVGNYVYVSSFDDNLYALDKYNGTKLWSYATSAPVSSSPAVYGGVVYVGSDDGNIYALGAQPSAPAPTPVVLYPNTYVINVDGSITPDTNLIQRTGNTFSLTGNVNQEIWIKMNNAVLDGAGHQVADPVFAMDATNVTIQNLSNTGEIDVSSSSNVYVLNNTLAGTDWPWYETGVMQVDGSNHVTIKGNSITGGDYGIMISSSQNVLITENNVTGMHTIWNHPAAAIMFSNASNNLIYHNNFVNDTLGTYSYGVDSNNSMDNGAPGGGNYWNDGSGAQWGDRYPLEKPFSTSTTVVVQSPTPTPLVTSSPTRSPFSSTAIPSPNPTQSPSAAQTQTPLPTSTQTPTAVPASTLPTSTPKDTKNGSLAPTTIIDGLAITAVIVGLLVYSAKHRRRG